MIIHDIDALDTLSPAQLWEVASNRHNIAEIRQEAIGRWLFPDETDPDADPDDMDGGRLRELKQLATVLESDEINENEPKMPARWHLISIHRGA